MPVTRPGKLSAGAIIALFAFFGIFILMAALGEKGGDTFFSNLKLSIPMALAVISAATAFLAGIFSVVRSKERAILVYLSIAIGFIPVMFVVGQIVMPQG